jgi:hypothetical protein
MSDQTSNDRNKAAMREENSSNLNSPGKDGVVVRSPSQSSVSAVTKEQYKRSHPDPYRK